MIWLQNLGNFVCTQQFISSTLNSRVWQGGEGMVIKLDAAQKNILLTSLTLKGSLECLSCALAAGTVSSSAHRPLSWLRLSYACAADPVLPPRASHQIHPNHCKPQLKQTTSPSGPPWILPWSQPPRLMPHLSREFEAWWHVPPKFWHPGQSPASSRGFCSPEGLSKAPSPNPSSGARAPLKSRRPGLSSCL